MEGGGATECAAPAASSCWRCNGAGERAAKVRGGGAAAASDAPRVELVPCIVCRGGGVLKRTRREGRSAPPRKAFAGWIDVGPAPPSGAVLAGDGEALCSLTGRWVLLQSMKGHRYSTDDVVTAWVAWVAWRGRDALLRSGPRAGSGAVSTLQEPSCADTAAPWIADIGCGIGSVLLMSAWLHPRAVCVGAEAQAVRAALARRNVAANGVGARARVVEGDLRDGATHRALADAARALQRGEGAAPPAHAAAPTGCFDLVTGTPPYFAVSAGGLPPHEESARCLFEYRGGVEGYAAAAATLLAPRGLFVCCETALALERSYDALAAAGLRVLARVDVVPKAGKAPLFCVFVAARAADCGVDVGAAVFCPAPPEALPYEDMRAPAYAAYLDARPPPMAGAQAIQPRAKQPTRGAHAELVGRARAGEAVHVVTVRDASGERTPQYARLLWELGKPG